MPSVNTSPLIEAIRAHNAGRDPERLAMKFARMKENPFVFLRGACHLFYDSLPDQPVLTTAPLAWCCGDLHFENYGSYKADNRLAYFDIADHDEAALAPCTWDIVRLLTSIRCGADVLKATRDEALSLSRECLEAYRGALIAGKAQWVERDTSSGLIHDLLAGLQGQNRVDFLDRRTLRKGSRRQLKVNGEKALPASLEEQRRVAAFMATFSASQPAPGFFEVLDVARRVAGTGSLGLTRFVILIEGKGSPDANYLLDLKETRPSVLLPQLKRIGVKQPAWADEAERVVTIQKRMQAVDHAFLRSVDFDGVPCILKELQPSEDRVALDDRGKNRLRLQEVVGTMGRVLAWDQLRSAGRGGSAGADELIAFAEGSGWIKAIMAVVESMARTTRQQWEIFRNSSL